MYVLRMSSFHAPSLFCAAALLRSAFAGLATGVGPARPVIPTSLRGIDYNAVEDADHGLRQALAQAAAAVGRTERRLGAIEVQLRTAARTLPADPAGRFGPRSVRYLLQNFFAQEYGWTLVGLEPHGYRNDVSRVHDVHILKEKVPMVADLLSENSAATMTLSDVAKLAAVLERVVDDENREMLALAYELNGLVPEAVLNDDLLDEVMFSFMLLFEMGFRLAHGLDKRAHDEYKREALSAHGSAVFEPLIDLQHTVTATAIWRGRQMLNPFVDQRYSFEDVSEFASALMSAYPSLLNKECAGMKSHLQSMTVPGTGAVPLGKFYAERGNSNLEYSFTESLAYLGATGALDSHDNVRIANYLPGPTNCMQTSSFFSVCCRSECDVLLTQLMSMIQAPTATPELILSAVENATWGLADEPLVEDAAAKLALVAERHEGRVPLHSRLFAQWLHYVFPNDCPYPHIQQADALSVQSWQNGTAIATSDEISTVIEVRGVEAPSGMPPSPYWDDEFEELLPLLDPDDDSALSVRNAARWMLLVFMAGAVFRYAMSGLFVARRAYYQLPLVDCRGSKHHLV